jgi:hypothetical protein
VDAFTEDDLKILDYLTDIFVEEPTEKDEHGYTITFVCR